MLQFFATIDYRTPAGNLGSQSFAIAAADFAQADRLARRRARVDRPGYRVDRVTINTTTQPKEPTQ